MIFLDIRTMYRKKTGGLADAYLKLINLRHKLDFFVDESYESVTLEYEKQAYDSRLKELLK